jgi:hypothetical protein
MVMTLTPNQKAARGQFLQKWYNRLLNTGHNANDAGFKIKKAMENPRFLSQLNGLIAATTPSEVA